MAYSAADLLKLQGNIKRDPDGYRDEFLLQYRHYQARLQIFQLNPSEDSKEFAEFITFIAQVSKVYPTSTAGFAPELMGLLEAQAGRLDPPLRRSMVSSLILLRNRNQLDPLLLLPLLFKLFRVNDKALRELLFRHIIADLKSSNRKGRNERLNRGVQAFLYSMVNGDESELAAKKALAVLSELWRRKIWRDARTVNCIASAVFHKSPRVMAAALKFFLGQESASGDDDDEDDDDDAGTPGKGGNSNKGVSAVVAPTKEEVYKATHKGTKSSKKKKQAKLKRVVHSLKKAARREAAAGNEGFAALHLLHDPQGFAERLFSRLQVSRERWETRLDMMMVLSRVVGVHKLLLLNLYPFLQKYIAPHQRDVTVVLAALVQGVHELVPPDSLAPVLRQLVDNFVHDKARPEVMTVGLKSVSELCLRCPLVMTPELLQDLAEYKKFREKEVATAARGLIGAFREMHPELLAKRDRGRGADLISGPAAYGAAAVSSRLEGADLLEAALAAGSSSDEDGGSSDDGSVDGSSSDGGEEDESSGDESSGDEGEEGDESSEEGDESSEGDELDAATAAPDHTSEEGEGDAAAAGTSSEGEEEGKGASPSTAAAGKQNGAAGPKKQQQQQQPGSLSSLKKQLAAAKQQQQQSEGGEEQLPIEMTRIFTEDDFRRIRELKRKALIKAALSRHGLASASEAKKKRILLAAETEADEAMALAGKRAKLADAQVAPDDLTGRHKKRADKAERLASVMEGREGRDAFGARSKLKKKKTGGMSERQKQRQKAMPIAARVQQLKNRSTKARNKSNPRHFKGHFKGK